MSPSLTSERDREVLRSFARRIDPSDAGAHNNLGVLYYNKGLYEEAVSAFMRALELDAKMQVAQRNLEIAYFNTGYYDKKVSDLTERLGVSDMTIRRDLEVARASRRPRRALGAGPHARTARADHGRGGRVHRAAALSSERHSLARPARPRAGRSTRMRRRGRVGEEVRLNAARHR